MDFSLSSGFRQVVQRHLSEIAYVDSAGINLLFSLSEQLRGHQQKLAVVVRERSPIARMLSLTALDRAVSTYGTLEAALSASSP